MLFDSLFIISISIHFLYTKEDLASYNGIADPNNFNLLPLYRGRQATSAAGVGEQQNFNPLPLYRGRPLPGLLPGA